MCYKILLGPLDYKGSWL